MAINASNPKSLNPTASPYMRAERNNRAALETTPSFSGDIWPLSTTVAISTSVGYATRARPWLLGSSPIPTSACKHQLTQAWVYQEATACYNIYKQPFTVPYSHPYYFDIGKSRNMLSSRGFFGGGVGRFVAPSRPRAKRSDVLRKRDEALSRSADEISLDGKTTLMIKNVPNLLGRYDLLQILDAHCLEENQKAMQQFERAMSEYDFFYLPMDFVRRANLGYAFVNFTNTDGALRFWKAFDKYKWNIGSKRKTCEVSLATIQGKDALCNRYKNSVFPCHTNTYLPVVLVPARDGWRQSAPSVVGRRVDPAFPLVERRCCGRRKSLNK
ncbi:hypothetical protein OIU76_007188 [Salix suchowensis]|nr:hypothetical protein OIU76_007188 [Salix suchowensis]